MHLTMQAKYNCCSWSASSVSVCVCQTAAARALFLCLSVSVKLLQLQLERLQPRILPPPVKEDKDHTHAHKTYACKHANTCTHTNHDFALTIAVSACNPASHPSLPRRTRPTHMHTKHMHANTCTHTNHHFALTVAAGAPATLHHTPPCQGGQGPRP